MLVLTVVSVSLLVWIAGLLHHISMLLTARVKPFDAVFNLTIQ